MRLVCHYLLLRIGATIFFVLIGPSVVAEETIPAVSRHSVTFMASGLEVQDDNFTFGHAFMVIVESTTRGELSTAYGFWPKADSGKGMIKGPGLLKKEFRCSKEECLRLESWNRDVDDSLTIPIKKSEIGKIMSVIDAFNSSKTGRNEPRQYNLLTENCNTFVADVAKVLGYSAPGPFQPPTDFLQKLESNVKIEQARRAKEYAQTSLREAENARARAEGELARAKGIRKEAQMELEKAEKLREQAEREAAAAAQAMARSAQQRAAKQRRRNANRKNVVPFGWIKCTCPQGHRRLGRIVNGARWHPDGYRCS